MSLSLGVGGGSGVGGRCFTLSVTQSRGGGISSPIYSPPPLLVIRDFSEHATSREKSAKLDCADKLGVFLSLTPCNMANFDPLQ